MTAFGLVPSSPPLSSARNWPAFGIVAGLYLFLLFCGKVLLVSDELYFTSFAGQMSDGQIRHFIELNQQWDWVAYVLLPVLLLGKVSVIAALLATGYYVFTEQWRYRPFLRAAIFAELIFLLPGILKIVWFSQLHPHYELRDLSAFCPLSLASLVDLYQVEAWLRYPLQLLNGFELLYWVVLALLVSQLVAWPWTRAVRLVALTYGPALLVWVLFIMFLTVSFA